MAIKRPFMACIMFPSPPGPTHYNICLDSGLHTGAQATYTLYSRRRIKTEDKSKVVAAVHMIQFLAALAIFHMQYDFEEKD